MFSIVLFGTQACRNVPMTLQDENATTSGSGNPDPKELGVPNGLVGYASSSTSITIQWDQPDQAEEIDIRIEGKTSDQADGAYEHWDTVDATTVQFELTNLNPSQEYEIRIQARSTDQASSYTDGILVTTLDSDVAEDAIVAYGLAAQAGQGTINLSWNWTTGNAGLLSFFRIQRKVGTGPWANYGVPQYNTNNQTFTDTLVQVGQNYTYRLLLTYTDGTTYQTSPVGPVSPLLDEDFPTPTNLALTAQPSAIEVTWDWTQGSLGLVDEVQLQIKANEGQWMDRGLPLATTTTSYMDTLVSSSSSYKYRLVITYDNGDVFTTPEAGPVTPINNQLDTPGNFHFDYYYVNGSGTLFVDLDWTYTFGEIDQVDMFLIDIHGVDNLTNETSAPISTAVFAPVTHKDDFFIHLSYFGTQSDDHSIVFTLRAINDVDNRDPSDPTSIEIRCINGSCQPE